MRFLAAATWHGPLDPAEAIRAAHPEIGGDIHIAAVLGDDATVCRLLENDPSAATSKTPPYNAEPLVYLCLSKYLRLDGARSDGFVRAATALLNAGADPNAGFFSPDHRPQPEFETALYGAAGVAHHPGLTRLLVERGADPNDGEVAYHAPETYDNATLRVLVESGRLTADSLATMLLRKADFHDHGGIVYLLEHRADPNRPTHWRYTGLQQAVRRDNALRNIEAMLDRGGDPAVTSRVDGRSAVSMAARRGRGDALAAFAQRGCAVELRGVERLIAACATNDVARLAGIAEREPRLVSELVTQGGTLLAEFAGVGNAAGVRHLLDLGVPTGATHGEGDGYFDVTRESTALHVAAWRARHDVVKLLLARGAPLDARDGKGRTALALAVKACVDSYWTEHRSPESVLALLAAGASVDGVTVPSGYEDVDTLLRAAHGDR